MIIWRRLGIQFAEIWFDEPLPEVDLAYLMQRAEPPNGVAFREFRTMLLDLTHSVDRLFAACTKDTRNEIRRAEGEGVQSETFVTIDGNAIKLFSCFYNRFAAGKGISRLRSRDLVLYRAAGMLDLSCCRDSSGAAIVWHTHLVAGARARLLHSSSLFRETEDHRRRNFIGRANRYLHWQDILRFKELGLIHYDLGGWYEGSADRE
ncbi:MAG: hypothetical protein AAGU11_14205, partial [Syntrophobacteraceae bacterium]